jgi:hypothetical protein
VRCPPSVEPRAPFVEDASNQMSSKSAPFVRDDGGSSSAVLSALHMRCPPYGRALCSLCRDDGGSTSAVFSALHMRCPPTVEPLLPLSRMRAPRCFSASAACSCDRRDVWYMVFSCYLFRFCPTMARVDVVTSAPCLSSRSTVSWSSEIRRAVCTSVVEADISVWPRCFLAVCLQFCCVRSLIDIYFTTSGRSGLIPYGPNIF